MFTAAETAEAALARAERDGEVADAEEEMEGERGERGDVLPSAPIGGRARALVELEDRQMRRALHWAASMGQVRGGVGGCAL